MNRHDMTRTAYYALPEDQRGTTVWPSGTVDRWAMLNGNRVTVRLYESADQFPLAPEEVTVPVPFHVAYAYSPRETANSRGATHLILEEALSLGRVKRAARTPLCGKKTHWGLEPQPAGAEVYCVKCAALARRLFPKGGEA